MYRAEAATLCSVGSLIRLSPLYDEAFENGIKLSISKKDKYRKYNYSPGVRNAINVYNKMNNDKCDVIIGLNNTDELTTISKLNPAQIIISPYGHNFHPQENIISLVPSPEYYANKLPFLLKKIKASRFKQFYIIYASNRLYTTKLASKYEESLQSSFKNVHKFSFNEMQLSSSEKYIKSKIANIKNNSLVFVLGGLISSSKIIKIISKKDINIEFIGTPNLGSKNYPALSKVINKNHKVVYIPRYISSDSLDENFQERYQHIFKKSPLLISILSHDAIILANKILRKKMNSNIDLSSGISIKKRILSFRNYFIIKVENGEYDLFN